MALLIFAQHGGRFEPGLELWPQFLYFDHGCEALLGLGTLGTRGSLLDIGSRTGDGDRTRVDGEQCSSASNQ